MLVVLLLTACGARFDPPSSLSAPGAAGSGAAGSGLTAADGGAGAPETAGGDAAVASGSGPVGTAVRPGVSSGGRTAGPSAPGAQAQPSAAGTAPPSGQQAPVAPGSRTGVTDTTIKLGFLAPMTGAAPVPPSARAMAQNYWDVVNAMGGIHGRTVTVKVYDTQSTESGARDAIKQAEDDGIFAAVSLDRGSVEAALLSGLEKAGIPHLPVNVPEGYNLGPNSFQIGTGQSASTRQVAQYMAKVLKVKRVGLVGETAPLDYPAADAFRAEAKRLGLQIVHDERINGQDSQYLSESQKLANDKAEAVLLFTAATPAIKIASSSAQNGYHPSWMGSSALWGLNVVLSAAGGAFDGAVNFSPWGGLSDPRYAFYNQKQTENQAGNKDKDIGLNTWGVAQPVAAALLAAGRDVGRNSFRNAMQNLFITSDPVTKSPLMYGSFDFRGGKRSGSGDLVVALTVKGTGPNAEWQTGSPYRSRFDQ